MTDPEECPGCGGYVPEERQICHDCREREREANNRMRKMGINPHKL